MKEYLSRMKAEKVDLENRIWQYICGEGQHNYGRIKNNKRSRRN